MRWPAFATIGLLCMAAASGCGGSTSGGGGGGGGGGSSSPADLASAPADLTPRSLAGIACGAVACTATSQLCCSSDSGKSGDCSQNGGSCGSIAYHCDGPEDCEPGLPQCCFQGSSVAGGSISQCQSSGYCALQATGQLMCHVDADCGTSLKCCPAAAGSPYAFCKSSC
jgi:hypothetical protein